jgi:hypothetical protein
MPKPSCATCRFYQPESDQPRDVPDFGRCYRYPESRSAGVLHWCGEHAPTPAVGSTSNSPELPDGWRMADDYTASGGHSGVHIDEYGDVWITGTNSAPLAVIEFVARHRARAGGAA